MLARIMLLLALPAAAYGITIHVPEDYPAIGLALVNAAAEDTVYVTGGPYMEWNLHIPPGVTLFSPGYAGVRIDALQQGKHFSFNNYDNAHYVIEGFELVNGRADTGGSIESGALNVDLTVRRCLFHDNSAYSVRRQTQ